MSDYVLVNNDIAMFLPNFGAAIVVVRPGALQASGAPLLQGNKICLEGDEKKLSVPGCAYMTPTHPVPGIGTITIDKLAADQKTKKFLIKGKPALLKGGQFTAKFKVVTPAQQPPPASAPDSTMEYQGRGQFITKNIKLKSK